jgi:hypothetical protein
MNIDDLRLDVPDDPPAGPSELSKEHQINQLHSSDGALPTTACRVKRENGGLGEDPRKSDDTPEGPSDRPKSTK